MEELYFEITKWPEGYGLSVANKPEIGSYGFAGACGGGVGKIVQTFRVSGAQLEILKEIINGQRNA